LKNNIDIVDGFVDKFLPLEHFKEYLKYGYYPFYFKEKNKYLQLLNAVINQTIDIDFVKLNLVKSSFTNKLKKLLIIIAQSNPFELNIPNLHQT